MATFCCAVCRLLQPPTTEGCGECGSPMVAPIELMRELLYYRDMRMVGEKDWGMITAMIAGGSIVFPVLTPVAIGSMFALGISKLRQAWRRKAIKGVALAPLVHAAGAVIVNGTARKIRAAHSSLVPEDVIGEYAAIRNAEGWVVLRHGTTAPFWLDREDAPPLLVTGAIRHVPIGRAATEVSRGDDVLRRLGVPKDFAIAGRLEVHALRDGQPVALLGEIADEALPEAAFHRDGGLVPVMRGHAGAPIELHG